MKKVDNIKKIVGISILILIVVIAIYALLIILPDKNKGDETKEVDKIKYGYIQYNRDNRLYKDIFNELKSELEKETIDYKKYAEYISKLFIVDLYTLNNKNSKEDVGGVQYLKEEVKENFILNASNTMYKYIGIDDTTLPEVKSIELESVNESKYIIDGSEYESYDVSLKWDYKKDLGYDKEGKIVVIKDGEQLYIVEKE